MKGSDSKAARQEAVTGLRVCMVVYSHYPDDPRVSREARTVQRAGVEVDVICLRADGQRPREEIDGIHVRRIPLESRRGSRLRYTWQYAAFFLLATAAVASAEIRRRYHLVHIHSLPDFLVFASALPRAFGVRVILDLHEAMPEVLAARFQLDRDAFLVRLARALERVSSAFADEIFVVNETIRDLLVSRRIPSNKITVLPNTPDELAISPVNRLILAQRFGLRGAHSIVIAGGLNAERDLETLIRSLALPPLAGSVDLLLLGRGERKYLADLRALTNQLGLGDRVVLGGFVPHSEALSLLSLSEVGVVTFVDNPITRLGLPNRLFEYAMLGKPLVVPRLPAIESFVGENAFYYQPGRPDELASAIANALHGENAMLRSRLEHRYQTWRWSEVSNRLLDAYRRARLRTSSRQEAGSVCT